MDATAIVPQIRPLRLEDLAAVANIHLRAFSDSALSKLGSGAVERYYRWQLTGPHDCTAIGIWSQEKLAGFGFAGVFNGALGGFVRRNRLFLAGRVLCRPWLLTNPIFRERFQMARKVLGRKQKPPSAQPRQSNQKPFGILSIAVDPSLARNGLGRLIMEHFEQVARQKGFEMMDLSVHPENTPAIRLYEKLGWQKASRDGRWTGVMTKSL